MRACVAPPLFILHVMNTTRNPAWVQHGHAPIRGRSTEDGGGPPGYSTSKGEKQKVEKSKAKKDRFLVFSSASNARPGEGMNAFLCLVSCWQTMKKRKGLFQLHGFLLHCRWQCTAPNELPNAGPSDAQKGASPGLGRGVHAFFCVVFGLQCVGKYVAWIQERWQCSVMLAFMGGMLGQGTRLKARRLTLAYTNLCLYVFFLHSFCSFSTFGEGNGGCSGVCVVPRGMLGEVTQRTAPVKTPWSFFHFRHFC